MKTIYLLRHADAESRSESGRDHDRDLTPKGRRQARRVGQFLHATEQVPDRIVTSSAVRARETGESLSEGGRWSGRVPLRSTKALYECDPEDVLDAIHTTGGDAESVLLVGHQPTWATTISRLTGGSALALPVATCARLDAPVDAWTAVGFSTARLSWLLPPHLLR